MMSQFCDKVTVWLKEHIQQAGAQGGMVGLSGGVDSAVVAASCKKTLGENMLALIMPCHSDPIDEAYAHEVAATFDIAVKTVCLDAVYDAFRQILPPGYYIVSRES